MTEDLHEHEIDGLFRRGLEGAEDSPSPGLWSAIEKGLGPTPPPAPQPIPSGGSGWMHPLLLKGLAGIAILAAVGTASYFLGRDSQRREQRQQEKSTEATTQFRTSSEPASQKETRDGNDRQSMVTPATEADENTTEERVDTKTTAGPDAMDTRVLTRRPSNLPAREAPKSAGEVRNQGAALSPKPETPVHKKLETSSAGNAPIPRSIQRQLMSGRMTDPVREEAANLPGSRREKGRDERIVAPSELTPLEQRGYVSPMVVTPVTTGRRFTLAAPMLDTRVMAKHVSPIMTKPAVGNKTGSGINRQLLSRFSLMPMLSSNTTHKRIEEDETFGPRNGREHREMEETESYGTTVSPGLYAAFDITPRLSVQSGFSELKNEISISPKDIRAVRDRDNNVRYRLDCSAGTFYIDPKTGTTPSVGDSIRLKSSDVRTRYASIPLHLMYRVGTGRLTFFGMAGAEMNILVNRTATTTFQNASSQPLGTVRAEGLRPTTVNAVVGAGIEYGIGKRLSISVIPQYRTALRSANEEGPVKSYPKTVSVAAGLRVRF